MGTYLLYGLHFIVCIAIIVIVLLQADKGSGLSGAFGGGGSYAKFGDEGGFDFMGKATTVVAVLFMVLSLFISVHTKHTYNNAVNSGINNTQPSIPAPSAIPDADTSAKQATTTKSPVTNPITPVTAPAPKATETTPKKPK